MRVYACVCAEVGGGGEWNTVIMTWKCCGDESVPTVFYRQLNDLVPVQVCNSLRERGRIGFQCPVNRDGYILITETCTQNLFGKTLNSILYYLLPVLRKTPNAYHSPTLKTMITHSTKQTSFLQWQLSKQQFSMKNHFWKNVQHNYKKYN